MLDSKLFDHTILKPEATKEEVEKICNEALEFNFASVCVNSYYTAYVKKLLAGSTVKTCTVVGFPLGQMSTRSKADEARNAILDGAEEIDMVLNIGALKSKLYEEVKEDITAVKIICGPSILLKVILETCLLTKEEIKQASLLAKQAGADFIKTSTGFSKGGATKEDVALMRKAVGPLMGVKASGGIHNAKQAKELIEAGATRLGTSKTIEIIEGDYNE